MTLGYDVKQLHASKYSDVAIGYGQEEQLLTDQKSSRFFEVRWYSKSSREFVKEVDAIVKAIDCPKLKRERKVTYISPTGEKVLK